MKILSTIKILFVVLLTLSGIAGCKKTNVDPGDPGNPSIVANTTIRDVKARYTSGTPVAITDDLVIEGVVSCDDKNGNYYQQIALQDATGGVFNIAQYERQPTICDMEKWSNLRASIRYAASFSRLE